MAGAIAAACIGAGVAIATTATSVGMQADAKHKASKSAFLAQQTDAQERARQENQGTDDEMLNMVMAMTAPADPNGDAAMNQYLQAMGYMAPGGAQAESAPGEPSEPPDPSTPRQ